MTTLVPCPSCNRHVKLDAASTCPFCAADLRGAEGRLGPAKDSSGGARRAALLAVSAALASTAFIACGDDSPTGGSASGGSNAGGQAQGGQAQGGDNAGGQVAIGGAGGQETSGGGGAGGDGTGGNIAPPYGAPPV